MSNPLCFLALTGMLLCSLCTASVASAAYADPPGRVARLAHTQGAVSYSPTGEDAWINVVRNRPLSNGDRLWTDSDARAEFQVGSAAIRLGSNTSVDILDLSDRIAQVQLTQGTLNLRVRRMYLGQSFEVATPTLAFTINHAGRYRIDVDPHNAVTTIVVWEGAGEAYGENTSFPLRAGDTVRFYGADLRHYEMYGLPREDAFDRYSRERDRHLDRSIEPAKESAPGTSDHGRDKERKGQGDAKPQAAEKQQAERQRQAECERQAIQQHQDVSQCLSETPPQEHTNSPNGGNSNRDNNRK
jgi:hypothetical protein